MMQPRPSAVLLALALALTQGLAADSRAPAGPAGPPGPLGQAGPAGPLGPVGPSDATEADTARLLADEDVWSCARGPGLGGALACLETKAMHLLDVGVAKQEEEARRSGELPLLERAADLSAQLLPDLTDALVGGDAADAEADDDDDDDAEGRSANDVQEEGRGKKKKKKKALMKLLFVAMLIKNKLGLLFQGFGALLQIKFFGIAILQLLLTMFRLYLELSKKKEPQKVIYYEHAQHQHHYEHEHHYDDEKGGWGGLWGRSYEEAPAQGAAASSATRPVSAPDAHQQAYSSYFPRNAA